MLPSVARVPQAAHFFRQALAASPSFKPASKNLRAAESALANWKPPVMAPPGVCIIREWGAGFWSDVNHTIGGILFAHLAHREPWVWWGDTSLYSPKGGVNAWELFFEPVAPASSTAMPSPLPAWPNKWAQAGPFAPVTARWNGPDTRLSPLAFFPREEAAVVVDFFADPFELHAWRLPGDPLAGLRFVDAQREMVARYVKPKPAISAEVDAFAREHFGNGPVVAAHWRGTDKVLELEGHEKLIDDVCEATDAMMKRHPGANLFLMTDSAPMLARARTRYGDKLLTRDIERTATTTGLHFLPGSPEQKGRDVLIDTLLAARAQAFTGLGFSNVGCFVEVMGNWAPGACTLVGPKVTETATFLQYLMPNADTAPGKK